MPEKLYTYFHGDKAEKTSNCTIDLYGGLFYEVLITEGHLAGCTRLVAADSAQWHLETEVRP